MKRESKRRSVDEWRAIVIRAEAPGKTQREFCESEGITPSSLDYWRKKFGGREVVAAPKGSTAFIELQGSKRGLHWELEVVLPNGTMMRFGGEA